MTKATPAPTAGAAGAGLLVVSHGRTFACSRADGDIHRGLATGDGIYADDTRYVDELRLRVAGVSPRLVASSADVGYEAHIDLTVPAPRAGSARVPPPTLRLRRVRLVNERVYELVEVANHGGRAATVEVELFVGADFADIFEVRGIRPRTTRGEALEPQPAPSGVTFGYVGEDDLRRQTIVTTEPAPWVEIAEGRATLTWQAVLEPGALLAVTITIEPSPLAGGANDPGFEAAREDAERRLDLWRGNCARIAASRPSFGRLVDASIRDLARLSVDMDGDRIITAGIPWYVAPFGRDALLTCHEALFLNPIAARDALRFLARHQASSHDPERDSEPGKIMHELRGGELARCGYIPHSPYYGSVDSTPLFVMLAGSYFGWTADLETMTELEPALDAALAWMDDHGDRDGDGFLEYERRSRDGLLNQGWKDSEDAIVHADGSPADPPIALVEVQGYAYMAKEVVADVYEALSQSGRARTLRREAAQLKEAFNDAFWMEDEGTYALGLDATKRQIRSVTSNPGHSLYCSIADEDRGRRTAERLMADDMFSGWGVRTLSSDSPAYDPSSYHNGSVWPHDSAIIAAGLRRYGAIGGATRIATGLVDAARGSPEARLPELICGFPRRPQVPYVPYPVACRPQAWAAAAPFLILEALLGLTADASHGLLGIDRPVLPEWLGSIEIRDLRVGRARLGLSFARVHEGVAVSVLDRIGDVRVAISQP
jgi:glycogen debranching enzyme